MDRQLHEVGKLVKRGGGKRTGELILRKCQSLQRATNITNLRRDLPGNRSTVQKMIMNYFMQCSS